MANNISIKNNGDTNILARLLNDQMREEIKNAKRPEMLNHNNTSVETINRVINFWQNEMRIHVFFANYLDETVGFISLQLYDDIYDNKDVLSATLLSVYVKPENRRQGIAAKLIKAAEDLCVEQSVHAINVSWLVDNNISSELYSKCGYVPVSNASRKIIKYESER